MGRETSTFVTSANIDKMFINVLKGNVLKQERKNCILFEKEHSNNYLLYAGFLFSKVMVLNVPFLIVLVFFKPLIRDTAMSESQ